MASCPLPTSHRPDLFSGLCSCAEGGARRHARGHRWVCGSRPDRRRRISPTARRSPGFSHQARSHRLRLDDARLCRSRPLAVAAPSADELGSASPASCRTTRNRVSRLDSLIQLVLVSAGLVWLLLVPFFPILILGGAARVLELTSIWSVVYAPMVVLTAAQVVFHAVNYMRPYWTPARSVARILLRLGTLLLWVTLLTADTWVAASGGSTTTSVPSLEQISRASTSAAELR